MRTLTRSLVMLFICLVSASSLAAVPPTTTSIPAPALPALSGQVVEGTKRLAECHVSVSNTNLHAYVVNDVTGTRKELSSQFLYDLDKKVLTRIVVNGQPVDGDKVVEHKTFPACDPGYHYADVQVWMNATDFSTNRSVWGSSELYTLLRDQMPVVVTLRPGWIQVEVDYTPPAGVDPMSLVLISGGNRYYYDSYLKKFIFWVDPLVADQTYVIADRWDENKVYIPDGHVRYGIPDGQHTPDNPVGSCIGTSYIYGIERLAFDPANAMIAKPNTSYTTVTMTSDNTLHWVKSYFAQLNGYQGLSISGLYVEGYVAAYEVVNGKLELIGYKWATGEDQSVDLYIEPGRRDVAIFFVGPDQSVPALSFYCWFGFVQTTGGGGGGKG